MAIPTSSHKNKLKPRNYLNILIVYFQLLFSKMTSISIFQIGLIQDIQQWDFSIHYICGRDVLLEFQEFISSAMMVTLSVAQDSFLEEEKLRSVWHAETLQFWICRNNNSKDQKESIQDEWDQQVVPLDQCVPVEETAMLALETFAKLKRYSVIVLMNNKFVDFVFPQLETWWQLEVMTTNYIYFL